jgi:hypothetical protein
MTISPPEREEKKARVIVDKDPVPTSFEKWATPGHFDRTLARGPKTTTWIWNLHALAHDTYQRFRRHIPQNICSALRAFIRSVHLVERDDIPRREVFQLRSLVKRPLEH